MGKPEDVSRELLERQRVTRPPIDVDQLARTLGAQVVLRPFPREGDVSGMLFRDGRVTIIGANKAHPRARRRFTIAHEIGHLLLHPGRPMIIDGVRLNLRDGKSGLATDRQEIGANQFAASLLMPRDMLGGELERLSTKKRLSEDELISSLANTFDVSREAMTHRLTNLGALASPPSAGARQRRPSSRTR